MRRLLTIAGIGFILATGALAAPQEVRSEEVTWLGVQLGNQGTGSIDGVPIVRVFEDSPAHKGGLRARDVLVGVDGQRVANNSELQAAIRHHDSGSWIELSVMRGERERDLRVRLSTRPQDQKLRPLTGWIGLRAISLPPPLREHFGAPSDAGIMISEVVAGSPAESAGILLGDVIFEVDGEPVKAPGGFYKRIAGGGVGNKVQLRAARWGQEIELEAAIEVLPNQQPQR